jgi:hypothetical protein
MTIKFGLDMGQSSLKLVGAAGGLAFPSQTALFARDVQDFGAGGKRKKPVIVEGEFGKLWVGHNAHVYGDAVENMSYERLSESSEIKAVFCGAWTEWMNRNGAIAEPVRLVIGLPFEMLYGDRATVTRFRNSLNGWMVGTHSWIANGKPYQVQVEAIYPYPQALGAPIDYAVTMDGQSAGAEFEQVLARECGTISIGSKTVELLVNKRNESTHKFNAGKPIGVRRLWKRLDPSGRYTFGEFCEALESNDLPMDWDVDAHLDSWMEEIRGYVNDVWGDAYQRFHKVFMVGGGAILLQNRLKKKFNGKAVFVSDPVMSIGRGMFKAGFAIK